MLIGWWSEEALGQRVPIRCRRHEISREQQEGSGCSSPFLDVETRYVGEMSHVLGDDRRTLRNGVSGDHEIRVDDGFADALEMCADAGIVGVTAFVQSRTDKRSR